MARRPGVWGVAPERIAARCRQASASRSTRPARRPACRSTSSARCRRRRSPTPRPIARRDRGLRLGAARPGRRRRRSAVEPRAHPAVEPRRRRVERRARPRPADAGRPGAAAADAQARGVRPRHVLPAEGSHRARAAAQRAARVAVVRGVGPGEPLDIDGCCTTDDGTPAAAIVTIAHLADEERQFVDVAPARQAGHVDAPPDRHHRPARARLHGRGARLRAADRRARRRRSRSSRC